MSGRRKGTGQTKTTTPAGPRGATFTMSEVDDLIRGLYDTGCRIIHDSSPGLTVPMVRAVFDRWLAVFRPETAALMRRYEGKAPEACASAAVERVT